MKALELHKGLERIVILADTIHTVSCATSGSRNISCRVNGLVVEDGFDSVLNALGWEIIKP